MKKTLLKSLLVAVSLLTGTLHISADEVKFDFTQNEWNLPVASSTLDAQTAWITDVVTKNKVDIVFKFGTNTSNRPYYLINSGTKQVRVFKNNIMKVFAPAGKAITKIEFEKGNYFNLSTATGELTETTWTGNAAVIKFKGTGTNWIYSMTVTYEDMNAQTVIPQDEEETIVLDFNDYLNDDDEDGFSADKSFTVGNEGGENRFYVTVPCTTDPKASQNKAYYNTSKFIYYARLFNGTVKMKVDPDKIIKKLTFAGSTWNANNTLDGITCSSRTAANNALHASYVSQLGIAGQTILSTITVTVVDRPIAPYVAPVANVELDETATELATSDEPANVVVKRAIAANEWAAVAFPFDMDEATVKANFGDDVQLAEFTGANGQSLTVFFNTKDNVAMEAGVPYLIKTSKDVEEVKAEGVTVSNEVKPVTFSPFKFVPTFTKANLEEGWIYVGHNNMLKSAEVNAAINGFRAYFQFPVITVDDEPYEEEFGAKPNLVVDGEATGIRTFENSTIDNSAIYDIQGRRVANPTRGLYIVNGNKVVIK